MKKLIIIAGLFLLIGAGCQKQINTPATDNQINQNETQNQTVDNSKLDENADTTKNIPNSNVPFQKSEKYGYYGKLDLEGYMEVIKPECNPEGGYGYAPGECLQDYVNFVVTKSSSPLLFDFLNDGGNFKTEGKFQLGCYQKGLSIKSMNTADSNDPNIRENTVENNITGQQLSILESSNVNNPVKLQTERAVYTSGRGVAECYSHFRNFVVSE